MFSQLYNFHSDFSLRDLYSINSKEVLYHGVEGAKSLSGKIPQNEFSNFWFQLLM